MRNLSLILFAVMGCGDNTTVVEPTSVAPSPIPVVMHDMAVAPQPSMPPAAAPDMAVPPTTGPQTVTVMVGPGGGMSFQPAQVTIHAGDTVHWQWAVPSLPHTVTSGTVPVADGQFCSAPDAPSATRCARVDYAKTGPASFDHTFPTAGSFPYFCEIHGAMMTGTVIVQ